MEIFSDIIHLSGEDPFRRNTMMMSMMSMMIMMTTTMMTMMTMMTIIKSGEDPFSAKYAQAEHHRLEDCRVIIPPQITKVGGLVIV